MADNGFLQSGIPKIFWSFLYPTGFVGLFWNLAELAIRLNGRAAVITGGGSGISRAVAELFAAQGARVAVANYSANGSDTARSIQAAGGVAIFTPKNT